MFRLTRHGWREIVVGTLVLLAVASAVSMLTHRYWIGAVVTAPILIWLIAFFRDPHRAIPSAASLMVSPADGRVSDITHYERHEYFDGPCVRVGIFLSVFNVHVNRAPCAGRVVDVVYKRGKFINAMSHDDASSQNESNTIVIAEPDGQRRVAVVKQIVGLIARRIICTAGVGSTVERGGRIGMIKFGSRTELYIPRWLEPQIQVAVGQNIRGAADVIAVLAAGAPV